MISDSRPQLTAVVLAGGKGSRLMPHTAEIPKPLVDVGGRPVVEYLLVRLRRSGVRRVVMAVNHMADQIERRLGDGSRFGLAIEYSHESTPLSTIGPLRLIKNLPDDFVVANGDVLTDLDVRALYQSHIDRRADLTVATYRGNEKIDFGVLELDENNGVVGFREKPDYSFIVSMGIYVFNRSVLDLVPPNQVFGFDQLMFALLEKQRRVFAHPYDGFWLDIGRPSDYERAQAEGERIKGWCSL
ncbi:MAG: sugar phosphate nucleotidyltransferase [Candidatus Zixiibacteriota bacterium]